MHEAEVLRVLIQSAFQPVPASVLADLPGKTTQARVDYANQRLNLLGFQILLYKRAKANYVILTDMQDQRVLTSDEAAAPTPAPEPTPTEPGATEPTGAREEPEAVPAAARPLSFEPGTGPLGDHPRVQNPLLAPYQTVRAVLLYFQHETDLEQLLHFLATNSNPFGCGSREELRERWAETLQGFVARGMLGQRRAGQADMVSDAGGEGFLRTADLVAALNGAGAAFNAARELERYRHVDELYRRCAAR